MNELLKILLIDDDEVDRMILKRAIKSANIEAEIKIAEDVAAGISAMEKNKFDCVFLDYMLPGGDGLKVLKEVKEKEINTPIIVVTAHGDERLAVEMMKSGASDYITKDTVTPDSISHTMRNVIRLRKSEEQKKIVEDELRAMRERLEYLLSSSPAVIFSSSADDFSATSVSSNVTLLLGYTPKEFISDKSFWKNHIHPEDIEQAVLQMKSIFEKNRVVNEYRFLHKDGNYRWLHDDLILMKDEKGNPLEIIGSTMDITDRKIVEQELIKAKQETEKSAKVKEQFLANVSHEIRTPMNGIMGISRLLLQTKLNDEQQQYVDAIKTSADNLLIIINDLLDISKIEAGKMRFEYVQFKLADVLNSVGELVQQKAKHKNISIEKSLEEKIPSLLIGDPVRLNQILLNLVDNAIKFTEKGSVKIFAKMLNDDEEKSELEFSVQDSGIGIAEDKQKLIFESFTQASSDTTRKYGGTGLGLTIVKKLVELQGGNISLKSKLGEGSTFIFRLSFRKKADTSSFTLSEIKSEISEGLLKNTKVLLVEDNSINVLLAKKVLMNWGCEVTVAENGKDGLEKFKNANFEIILMDVQMPEMDGYTATQHIRKDFPSPQNKIPILAMTAFAAEGESVKCLNAGMNDYISKPFDQNVLYSKIAVLTGKDTPADINKKMIYPSENSQNGKGVKGYINLNYLKELSAGDEKFVKKMIATFVQQTPEMLENIQKHLSNQNWNLLKAVVHKMKPSIGFMGISELKTVVEKLEHYSNKTINLEQIPELVATLNMICGKAIEELNEELKKNYTKT